jgi:hypothetical protein
LQLLWVCSPCPHLLLSWWGFENCV